MALPFAAALAVRLLSIKNQTTMLIEATFADGSKTSFSFPLTDGGPFIRRVQPQLKVPGIRDEWCGVPQTSPWGDQGGMAPLRLGVLTPADDRTLVHEAMAFLTSLCDRPDLPFQLGGLEISDLQQMTEKIMRDLRQSASAR